MIRYVVDASIALKWFLDEKGSERSRLLLDNDPTPHFLTPNELFAPAILPIEVRYVLGKEFNKGKISLEMLIGSLSVLRKIFGSFTPIDDALLERASMLSFRLNDGRVTNLNDVPTFGIYDCLYIALALQSDSELVTADQKQAELARYHGVMTHLI